MRTPIANQGEIRIDRVTAFEEVETKPFTDRNHQGYIISHSENGHHHILGGDVEVLERIKVPAGMTILHAIVKEPTKLFQDATVPHAPVDLEPGLYEFRLKREFDPFSEQVRQVAD